MGSDALLESTDRTFTFGYNCHIVISVDSKVDATKKFFNGLFAGYKIKMPTVKSPWGSYIVMLTDKFGIQ